MKKLSIDEIKAIELNILLDVAGFCQQNNIDYFISCGTLLGAIRHKGFIPWDDDIDITMPRDSYERFISTYYSDKNYKVVSMHNSRYYNRLFARVVEINTFCSNTKSYDPGMKVCIDVFPMDFFNSNEHLKDIYQHVFFSKRNSKNVISFKSLLKNIVNKATFVQKIFYFFTNRNVLKKDHYVQSNSGQKGKYCSVIFAPIKRMSEIFEYSKIFPTKLEGNFENNLFRIPNDADYYLTSLYGNYMKMPSKEARKYGHYKEAYFKDET